MPYIQACIESSHDSLSILQASILQNRHSVLLAPDPKQSPTLLEAVAL